MRKKVTVLLSTRLAWPAWAGCSGAEFSRSLAPTFMLNPVCFLPFALSSSSLCSSRRRSQKLCCCRQWMHGKQSRHFYLRRSHAGLWMANVSFLFDLWNCSSQMPERQGKLSKSGHWFQNLRSDSSVWRPQWLLKGPWNRCPHKYACLWRCRAQTWGQIRPFRPLWGQSCRFIGALHSCWKEDKGFSSFFQEKTAGWLGVTAGNG